jgi:hypothetical protein
MQALPTPGQQGYNAGQVSLKYLYGGVRITGQVFELADKDFQAFASAADREISGLKGDIAKDQNRQFYGSTTGVMATATGANTGGSIPVANAQYLEVGMVVDVGTAPTLTKAVGATVTAVDLVAKTVTINPAPGSAVAASDVIVRTGDYGLELTGLRDIVAATGILYTINPTNDPYWKGVVDSNSGTLRPLSEGLMIYNVDRVRANGSRTTVMFTNLGVRRAYFELLVQQRRISNTQEFEGGFSGLAFTTDQGDIPLVVDMDCPINTLYGLNEKEIKLYQDADWAWMQRDGSMWSRVYSGTAGLAGTFDAYEAYLYKYAEIGTHRRNAHWVMQDITEG